MRSVLVQVIAGLRLRVADEDEDEEVLLRVLTLRVTSRSCARASGMYLARIYRRRRCYLQRRAAGRRRRLGRAIGWNGRVGAVGKRIGDVCVRSARLYGARGGCCETCATRELRGRGEAAVANALRVGERVVCSSRRPLQNGPRARRAALRRIINQHGHPAERHMYAFSLCAVESRCAFRCDGFARTRCCSFLPRAALFLPSPCFDFTSLPIPRTYSPVSAASSPAPTRSTSSSCCRRRASARSTRCIGFRSMGRISLRLSFEGALEGELKGFFPRAGGASTRAGTGVTRWRRCRWGGGDLLVVVSWCSTGDLHPPFSAFSPVGIDVGGGEKNL
ncbi:hypothetical protein B0H16DRAFT_389929 [Mycena metata]|uniref:Uncharacterized protein n=1 Tax=Mycena metata TaxID=1033252 RepID=A0AAD7HHH9_9AGAR|nr:hypothetical protein B0H16DRAFT_389929 [Mycena metata]